MIKMMRFLSAADDLTREQFRRWWLKENVFAVVAATDDPAAYGRKNCALRQGTPAYPGAVKCMVLHRHATEKGKLT